MSDYFIETAIAMTNECLQTILDQTRSCLERLYGSRLDRIVLYGSQARGDARPDSDIDVLIVLKEPFSYSLESDRISVAIAEICLEYATVISCAFATVRKYQEYDSGFFRNVRREGITL